jgi:NADH dehydrogenase FAD-containing subunit
VSIGYILKALTLSQSLATSVIQEPVRTILGPKGSFLQAKAEVLDQKNNKLLCRSIHGDEFEIEYDKLVIAVGVKTNTFGIPSIQPGNGIFFLKHLAHARGIRNNIIDSFEKAAIPNVSIEERQRLLSFVVVGGGPTSCEFTAELHGMYTYFLFLYYLTSPHRA